MATVESPTVDNGVNVTALLGAREAFTEAPTAPNSSGGPAVNGSTARTAAAPCTTSPASAAVAAEVFEQHTDEK